MRHRKSGNRLSKNGSLRAAGLRDMAKAVLVKERICTTSARAKEGRKLVDQLITLGKKDTLAARRKAFAILCDHTLVSQLFKQTAVRFKSRVGGYTRIIPYKLRDGDNAKMVFLELTEKTRTIITCAQKAAQTETVSDAEIKPAAKPAPETAKKAAAPKADVKAVAKPAAKPTGTKKLFQRKTGGE